MATYNNIKKLKIGDNTYNLYDSGGTVTGMTTTAGAHTAGAQTVNGGIITTNIPTKTSHLTNDSGFITTDSDKKLEIGTVANNTTNTPYYPILASNLTTAATRYYDPTGIHYNNVNGSTSVVGKADLVLGNDIASGRDNNKMGTISLYSSTSNYGYFTTADLTEKRTYTFPNKTGTVALTSDIVDEKVTNTAVTANSTYYLTGSSSSTTVTGTLDKHASISATVTADSSTSGSASIIIGNSTASGTANAKEGYIRLYGNTAYRHDIRAYPSFPSANRTIYLPRYTSTMYLTCVSTTSAVGGATTKPVYVDNTGRIQAVTSIPYTLLTGTPAVTEVEIVRW